MSYLLGRAGDCCFQIGHRWDQVDEHRADFSVVESFDAKMKAVMSEEETTNYKGEYHRLNTLSWAEKIIFSFVLSVYILELDLVPSEITTLDSILNHSWMCYSKALELENREAEKNNLQRRLGNICNELGSLYMKQARGERIV